MTPKMVAWGTADNLFSGSSAPGSGCLSGGGDPVAGVGGGGGVGAVAAGRGGDALSGDFVAVADAGCAGFDVTGEEVGSLLFFLRLEVKTDFRQSVSGRQREKRPQVRHCHFLRRAPALMPGSARIRAPWPTSSPP